MIKKESEKITQDIENARGKIRNGGIGIISFIAGIMSFLKNHNKKSKKINNN